MNARMALAAALVLLGCTDPARWHAAPLSPEPDRFAWATVPVTRPDLDAFVTRRALDAADLGLVPVVHVRTHWNSGQYLRRHMDDPRVRRALSGLYLIEIDYERYVTDDAPNQWAGDILCGTYAQTLHAVTPDGARALPSATPGKFGPDTAAEVAAMLHDYRDLLGRWNTVAVADRRPCELVPVPQ